MSATSFPQPHPPALWPHGRLLTTKLSRPRLRPTLVNRSNLLDPISASDAPVTLLCAPAGYGKSTLVAHWLIQSGLPSAWVSLDAYDNDPLDFFALVAAAIQTIDPSCASGAQALLDGRDLPSVQAIVHSLLMDIALTTRPFALVLDDYHVVEDQAIHAAIGTLLSNLPPTLRVFLLARTELPLPLARLRGRGDLLELGPEDLRFTDAEALDLLQRTNGLELTPGDVGRLNERAEGWVAGLQLVGHLLRGQPPGRVRRFASEFSGSVRSIENYLWEEVISRQPAPVQTFLLQTSILDRFTPPLCDAVTGGDGSAVTLRKLEHECLFVVALDDVGRWYRYHHLFADVLRERLADQADEEALIGLHRRAAAWLEGQDQIEESARHAVAGRDWERAVRLLERIATGLYEQDRNHLLHEWLQGLPDHVLKQNPQIAYYLAFATLRIGRLKEAVSPLRIAEEAWILADDRANLGRVRLIHSLRGMVALDAAQAIDVARQALDLLSDDQPDEQGMALVLVGGGYLFAGDCANAEANFASARAKFEAGRRALFRLIEMAYSSAVLAQRGKLLEATDLLGRVGTLADQQNAIPYQQSLHRLGDIYIEWNLLDDAERVLRRADVLSAQTKTPVWRGLICLGLAQVAWARRDSEAAYDEIDRAIEYAGQLGWQQVVRTAHALQARFWLASGQLPLVRRWAESCDLNPSLPPAYERQFEHLTFARLLVAEDRPALALRLLDAIAAHADAQGRHGDLVEIAVLQALAHNADGDQAAALAALDKALAIGEPGRYVRAFANEGEAIAPLLRHAATHGNHRDYARRLLNAIERPPTLAIVPQTNTQEALSERELEVLRLVATGLPNRDVGQRLFISEKTVKKHLSNILGKLEATNRTQAVDQARRLGLI